jgi:hypothetical protein
MILDNYSDVVLSMSLIGYIIAINPGGMKYL